jgi:hypothetical protein
MKPANFNFITPDWKPHSAEFFDLPDDAPRQLGFGGRAYQLRFHEEAKNQRRTLLISPTGSGKSIMKIFMAAHEIISSDYGRKQVFIVPELLIGNEFTEQKHRKLEIDGEVFNWEITTNCVFNSYQSVNRIKKFLLDPPHPCKSYRKNKVLGGVTAVVTYAALRNAWRKMSKDEKKQACKNTSFHVDETHHVAGVSKKESSDLNRLGDFCQFILDHDDPTCGLHLTTASFFRSTGFILDQKQLDKFFTFSVAMLEHWETLNLKELQQNYGSYESAEDLMDQVLKAIEEEPSEPALVYVPRDSSGIFKTANKNLWVKELVSKLEVLYPGRVLDLVSSDRQKRDKERFVLADQDFQIVVTCCVGREGADWKALSRIHNTHLDKSVLMSYQKMGRLMRPHENKSTIRITTYIRHFESWDCTPEIIRERLSDIFNAVVVAAMLDDLWFPILMPVVEARVKTTQESVTLSELYGTYRDALIERLVRDVASLPDVSSESIDLIINAIVDDFFQFQLVDVDRKDIVDRLRKEVVRRHNPNDPKLRMDGFLIDFVRKNGWDKVVQEKVVGRWAFHGVATTKDLKRLSRSLNDWIANLDEVKRIGLDNLKTDHRLYGWCYRMAKKIEEKKVG